MFDWRSPDEWKRVWRYYQAGVVNTLFGYGLFAGLVAAGVNLYVAQAVSHVIGMAFNYFTYSRHAFADRAGSKIGFFAAYVINYLLGLAFIWALSRLDASPYLAGFLATIAVSAINYLFLRNMVFREARP